MAQGQERPGGAGAAPQTQAARRGSLCGGENCPLPVMDRDVQQLSQVQRLKWLYGSVTTR